MYVFNVDRPDQSRLHLAVSTDKRCQPREKKRPDGLWREVETIPHAFRVAEHYSVQLVPCKLCKRFDEDLRTL